MICLSETVDVRVYRIYKLFFSTSLLAIYLTPSFKLISGFPSLRVDDFLILLWVFYVFYLILCKREAVVMWGWQQTMLAGFVFIIVIAILNGTLSGQATAFGDLNKVIKIGKYLLFYTLIVSLLGISPRRDQDLDNILKTIVVCSMLLVPVVVQQYFNLFSINEFYVKNVAPTQFLSLVDDYPRPRPVGMIGNPNELGFLYVLSALVTLYFVLKKKQYKYFAIMLVQISIVVISSSRGAIVALVVGSAMLCLLFSLDGNLKNVIKRLFVVCFCVFVLVCLFLILASNEFIYQKIFWRFGELANIGSSASWQVRLEVWNETLKLFFQNPIIGSGPLSRSGFVPSVDNEWLLMLRNYGLIGTFYFILMFSLPLVLSKKGRSDLYSSFLVSVFISTSVYMIPAFVFSSLELMPVILAIIASGDNGTKKITFNRQ